MTDITKKSLAEQYAGKCIHFNGVMNKVCKAGADYDTFPGPIPCLARVTNAPECAMRHFPNDEEVQAHLDQMEAHMQRRREDDALIGAAHVEGTTSTVYVCELCDRATRYVATVPGEIAAHMADAHDVDEPTICAAKGRMDAHLGAREWFQTDDRFILPNGRSFLIRSVRRPRTGSNKAAWADGTSSRKRARR